MSRQPSTRFSNAAPPPNFGTVLRLQGYRTQYVQFPSVSTNNFLTSGQYTYMGWINWSGIYGTNKIVRLLLKGGGINGFRTTFDTNIWNFQNINNFAAITVTNPFPMFINQFAHWAITYDGIHQVVAFYINGQPYTVAYNVPSGFWSNLSSDTSSPVELGSDFAPEGGTLYTADYVQVNSLLSPSQILDAYQNRNYAGSLAIYAKMNEGSGTTVLDYSGNHTNGTIVNKAQYIPQNAGTGRVMGTRITRSSTRTPLVKNNRVNPIGSACHLDGASNTELGIQLSLMAAAGIKWIRYDFTLAAIESTQGNFVWSKYDTITTQALAYGIQTIALIDQYNCPGWALSNVPGSNVADPTIYGQFCQAVAAHYGSQIMLYEMGNEPNEQGFWQPNCDPVAYTALLQAGYSGVKAGNPGAKVISAGLSNESTTTSSHYATLSFLQTMYAHGAQGYFDYLGIHPYSWPASPDNGFFLLDQCRLLMQANRDGGKQVIATEIGWPTQSVSSQGGVSEAEQAMFIARSFQKVMFEDYAAYVPILCFYDFKNDIGSPTPTENNFGIIRTDYTTKPGYTAVQQAGKNFLAAFNPVNP